MSRRDRTNRGAARAAHDRVAHQRREVQSVAHELSSNQIVGVNASGPSRVGRVRCLLIYSRTDPRLSALPSSTSSRSPLHASPLQAGGSCRRHHPRRRAGPTASGCAAEVHHRRHRRCDRGVLRRGRRHLPPGQQGPRQTRHSLLGRIDRRFGVQHQHHQGRRTRPRLRAERRAVQCRQRHGAVQGRWRLRRPARRVLGAPRAVHGAGAQGSRRQELRRLQGQALQRRQPRLGNARVAGGIAGGHGWQAERLFTRLGAQGRRTRAGAVRRQDRRLLLRRRPPEREHPGPDHLVRRPAGLDHRAGDRQAGGRQALLRQGHDPRRPVPEQPEPDPDLWRAGHPGRVEQGAGRIGVPGGEGGVRQLRGVQEAAPGAGEPEAREHGQATACRRRCTRARCATTRKRAGSSRPPHA